MSDICYMNPWRKLGTHVAKSCTTYPNPAEGWRFYGKPLREMEGDAKV
jgi:hypothetical protein